MTRVAKLFYIVGILLFLITFTLACLYANKMHTLGKQNPGEIMPDYQYHFMLIPEELDNDYWRLVEKGAMAAAKPIIFY